MRGVEGGHRDPCAPVGAGAGNIGVGVGGGALEATEGMGANQLLRTPRRVRDGRTPVCEHKAADKPGATSAIDALIRAEEEEADGAPEADCRAQGGCIERDCQVLPNRLHTREEKDFREDSARDPLSLSLNLSQGPSNTTWLSSVRGTRAHPIETRLSGMRPPLWAWC